MDKFISYAEFETVRCHIRFVAVSAFGADAVCGYCGKKNPAPLLRSCRYCGAPTNDGWRLVGRLDSDHLFVLEKELDPQSPNRPITQ